MLPLDTVPSPWQIMEATAKVSIVSQGDGLFNVFTQGVCEPEGGLRRRVYKVDACAREGEVSLLQGYHYWARVWRLLLFTVEVSAPNTSNPQHHSPYPEPHTPHREPHTLNPEHHKSNPQHHARNPEPHTPHRESHTPNPEHHTPRSLPPATPKFPGTGIAPYPGGVSRLPIVRVVTHASYGWTQFSI